MYGLDINFLKDRDLTADSAVSLGTVRGKSSLADGREPLPLIIGGALAALCLLGAGLSWQQAIASQARIQGEIAEVDQEIAALSAKGNTIQSLRQEIDTLKSQSQVFVEVLQTRIKPWPAILREIGDLSPPGLQINSFSQSPDNILVQGFARNFNDVNDLVLNLQTSPLFIEEDTYIVSAALVNNPATIEFSQPVESYTLPQLVEYTVAIAVKDLTDAELIQTLEEQGARGMAERLKRSF